MKLMMKIGLIFLSLIFSIKENIYCGEDLSSQEIGHKIRPGHSRDNSCGSCGLCCCCCIPLICHTRSIMFILGASVLTAIAVFSIVDLKLSTNDTKSMVAVPIITGLMAILMWGVLLKRACNNR
jgi:hypothetical protein